MIMTDLFEGLEFKALDGMVKPTVHIDEFSSKMGDDSDIVVLSFYVRDEKAAKDLANWFESGYSEVLDADCSPGELKPNRYLVYVEIRRRTNSGKIAARLLDDLESLTEFKPSDWEMSYEGKKFPFSREAFDEIVPLSPQAYRDAHVEDEEELNEWRVRAGIDTKPIYDSRDPELQAMQVAAGIS